MLRIYYIYTYSSGCLLDTRLIYLLTYWTQNKLVQFARIITLIKEFINLTRIVKEKGSAKMEKLKRH